MESQGLRSLEICAGAGGQALGLERAGFEHIALVEIEPLACETLRFNRSKWKVIQADLKTFQAEAYAGQIDLLAGGVPCPPFSVAGGQLGQEDERDLFPEALRLARECKPKAILLENVKGLLEPKFSSYRKEILNTLFSLGYNAEWRLIYSSDYGLSQLRPRSILVAMKPRYFNHFSWPKKSPTPPPTVGELLFSEMSKLGWDAVEDWRKKANTIAPTLVGGSKKHGGADLGPSRAKKAWLELGVNGKSLAERPPINGFRGEPRLTLKMTALLQGFPCEWTIVGRKTAAYRQIGNAFPPPVAEALGLSIKQALLNGEKKRQTRSKSEAQGILHG